MKQFSLELFQTIIGIGSASGLIYKDDSLFIISDNSSFLYQYHVQENQLSKIKLFKNGQENIPKKDKFDFESIALKGEKLHILGSGSTSKREKRITYNLETKETAEKDLSKLYKSLKASASISDEELNIEGAIFFNENWYLFQRGNGVNSKNGIFKTKSLKRESDTAFIPIQLPKIKQIETSCTDAILVDDKIYFLATAENTTSTYDDGEIFGSILAQMNSQTFEIEFIQKISDTHKFEGLTLYKKTENEIQFLICEDNDTHILETNIYKITFNKEQNERLKK
jgi:DNA-dependent RNA polymerase auxiliary subunit epsilon